jgi:uncharacterized integral membrane protein
LGILKSIVILLAGAALATFLWSNYDQKVEIYFTSQLRTVKLPLAAALMIALLAGVLLAVALSLPNQLRLRSRLRELGRKVDRLESENAELRKLPLEDSIPESTSGFRESRESVRRERGGRELGSPGAKPPGA